MKHTGHGIQFRYLIGESYSPDERKTGSTEKELRQMSIPQRMSVGRENRYIVDEDGIILGIKPKAVVYSC